MVLREPAIRMFNVEGLGAQLTRHGFEYFIDFLGYEKERSKMMSALHELVTRGGWQLLGERKAEN
jgi:hypothetical protein